MTYFGALEKKSKILNYEQLENQSGSLGSAELGRSQLDPVSLGEDVRSV